MALPESSVRQEEVFVGYDPSRNGEFGVYVIAARPLGRLISKIEVYGADHEPVR